MKYVKIVSVASIYIMGLQKGAFIKWISGHHEYEANGDVLVGIRPIYRYGIVIEVSAKKESYFIVASCDDGRWHLLDVHQDTVEILSKG